MLSGTFGAPVRVVSEGVAVGVAKGIAETAFGVLSAGAANERDYRSFRP